MRSINSQNLVAKAIRANLLLLAAFGWLSALAAPPPRTPQNTSLKIDFDRDIRPILSENCYKCHGPDDGARKAKLRFDRRSEALKPAKSGKLPIVPGAPDKSELLARITSTDDDERMPPLKTGKKLSPAQIDTLRRWISQGAAYAPHWAYVKPVRPILPEVKNKRWPHNPIDYFILARLEHAGLKPSPQADRYTLVRRVSLDLTGLPPSLEEVDRFVNDHNPHAYEQLVERLLAKPAFGEHWARMWLDLARYADSAGYADDPPRTIWAYRDWVIRAFNANKPFDQFTVEQIAGDLLDDSDDDDLIATAFHRNTMTNNEGGTNDEEFRNAAVVDRVNTTMSVWMATSMGCAQCHNHKYDPLSQQEYFQLFAILNNTADADLNDESPLLKLYSPQQKKQRAEWDAEIGELDKKLHTSTARSRSNQAAWEQNFPRVQQWLALTPASAKSRNGAPVQIVPPDAVQIAPLQKTEAYTVELPLTATQLTGLRLEVLPALPDSDPSQAANGGFAIPHVMASVIAPETNRVSGRFLRIEIPGKEKILSLAEVQVFAGKENIALQGEASQSSTAYEGPPKLAIDGNTDGNFDNKSTTHTEISENPWWEVDLKQSQTIDRIVIWNRTDSGLEKRLSDFHIVLFDPGRKPVWERSVVETPNPSTTFSLDGSNVVHFVAAFADQLDADAKSVIEEKPKGNGWALDAGDQQWHPLTLLPAQPVVVLPGSKLSVTVSQETLHDRCPPARFRLRVSSDEHVPDYAALPEALLHSLTLPPNKRSEEQNRALADYYTATVDPDLQPERERLAKLKKQTAEIQPNTVPVMRELTGDKRRKTHIEFRGNYLALGDEVTEGLPAAFNPLPNGTKLDRLGLARWLIDQNNPLTPRVIANRFWEQIFGTGIVRTCEDFGSQGERPSNPDLLDWLACQFRDGNTDSSLHTAPWDIKAFLKLLVTSATYQQSSRVTPELLERDPDNSLLSRGPRIRASAEVVRDQALAISGLLSHKMYGKPVRPPQPALGLSAAFGGTFDWKTSEGEDRYRRAVYIEWRRTSPYPSMATFDAPNREVCALRRPRSNTPLQALVTLNDPVYVEAAQALALRMANQPGQAAEKATYGFRLCVARPPHAMELNQLTGLFASARDSYAHNADEAKKLVSNASHEEPPENKLAEVAAWTTVANVLLNLDETLMKP